MGTIIENMEKWCAVLPEGYQKSCDDMVEQYGRLVIEYVTQAKTPEEICQLLQLCDAQKLCKKVSTQIICNDLAMSYSCGLTDQCLRYKLNNYLQRITATSTKTGSRHCWVCSRLVKAWTTHVDLFGRLPDNDAALCDWYQEKADADKCR